MFFLNLPFRSHVVFQRGLIPLIERLEANQDAIVLFVLALLVSNLHSVRWATQPLLYQVDLLERGAVPLREVLKRLNVADKSLLVVRILDEVIAHELLLGRLHYLI